MRRAAIACALALAACTSTASGVDSIRFHNQPPVWQVADREHVPVKPAERDLLHTYEMFDKAVYRRLTGLLDARARAPAHDINALDEVPDSTWFTNRIGRRDLTPAQIVDGPGNRPPNLERPLVVLSSKAEGATPGFFAKDCDGRKFLVKLDHPAEPTLGTGTHMVTLRLFWAIGYNVPNDTLGIVRRDQLELAPAATYKDHYGRKRAMTAADLDAVLALGARRPDGTYRVLFSELLAGEPLGGWAQEGVRADDPNDTIPHEQRRVLRGLSAFAGWLQHTDLRDHNTLDMYVTDPLDRRRYVMHYLIDFDKSLGAWPVLSNRPTDGHAALVDGKYFLSAFTVGLWKRPWEGIPASPITGIGMFDVEHYRPEAWTPSLPYLPFLAADERDLFWAVSIMLRFTREQVRAVVLAAQFADPRATDALTDILLARRDKTARYWLARVNPLRDFTLASTAENRARLCFVDLELDERVNPRARPETVYRAEVFDEAGRSLARLPDARATGRDGCLPELAIASDREGYTIVRIHTLRAGRARPAVEVHLARDPVANLPRIIGISR